MASFAMPGIKEANQIPGAAHLSSYIFFHSRGSLKSPPDPEN
jgi:hypothetical protein